MTFSEVCAALKTRFIAQWAASNPDVLVFWPNEQPENADGVTGTPKDDDGNAETFVRIDFQMGAQNRIEFGGGIGRNRWRQSGEVLIRLLAPSSRGTDTINALVDDATDAFISYATGDLHVYACAPAGQGSETGNYFQQDVIASFVYDRIG